MLEVRLDIEQCKNVGNLTSIQSMSVAELSHRIAGRLQLFLLSLAFTFVFLYPILCDSSLSGPGIGGWLLRPQLGHFFAIPSDGADRDMFTQLRWVPYYTLTHFYQLPFWNPYKCGGMPMLGNPESGIVTPFLLPYLIFGLIPGMLLEIYAHVAIMFAGGYVLGRELGLVPLAALVLAVIFPSSSWLSLHVAAGHLNFLSIAYIPWILELLLASCRLRRWHLAMLGGLLCGLTLTEGNYGFVFAAMLVALVAVWYAMIQLSIRPLLAAALVKRRPRLDRLRTRRTKPRIFGRCSRRSQRRCASPQKS